MTKQVFLLIVVKYEVKGYQTLSKACKIGREDNDLLTQSMLRIFRLKSERYHEDTITEIVFKFKNVPDNMLSDKPILHNSRNPDSFDISTLSIGDYNLPNTMNFHK